MPVPAISVAGLSAGAVTVNVTSTMSESACSSALSTTSSSGAGDPPGPQSASVPPEKCSLGFEPSASITSSRLESW